jgi:hypothetical protein
MAVLPAAERPASRESFRDRYAFITEHNIFLRTRSRPPASRPVRVAPPRQPEQAYVLRGVVHENGEYHAYVENLDTRGMLRLRLGDVVARGRITEIAIDGIDYEQSGQRAWVEVGKSLSGGEIIATPPSLAAADSTAPSTQPSSASTIDPNDPNLSIEDRLKLRRMQELKR